MRERIKQIIEREKMSQSQFADFIEVNRPTLSHILAGRNNPSMEVVMKIHQKFPRINILWLLDGVGSYEGDAVADYPSGSLIEDRVADDEVSVDAEVRADESVSSSSVIEESTASRFYQGELFAENGVAQREQSKVHLYSAEQASHLDVKRQNGVFAAESAGAPKNRKEIPLQTPQKAPYLSETQIEYAKKCLQRKIVEIKIFYNDGTYETFSHE